MAQLLSRPFLIPRARQPTRRADEAAEHRMKAEVCRRLADLSQEAERKTLWINKAGYWEELAAKVAKARLQKPPKT
jgi:hypothetical protein